MSCSTCWVDSPYCVVNVQTTILQLVMLAEWEVVEEQIKVFLGLLNASRMIFVVCPNKRIAEIQREPLERLTIYLETT